MISRGYLKESNPVKAVVICGPTGSGKSDVAMRLAEHYDGRIIGADSRQIYRDLDIGTAKPSTEARSRIKHYLIDVADVTEDFSAKRYAEMATAAIVETARDGKIPFIVGGAGLYLEALTAGLFVGPDKDEALRAELQAIAAKEGPTSLHYQLETVDPGSAERISSADTVRIIRALEVYRLTGKKLSDLQTRGEYAQSPADFLWLCITYDRKILYRRIDARVETMMANGLLNEIHGLLRKGLGNPIIRKRIVGYYEIIEALENKRSLTEATELIKRHSRNYAKRQMTWFRNKAPVLWFTPDHPSFYKVLHEVINNHLGKNS